MRNFEAGASLLKDLTPSSKDRVSTSAIAGKILLMPSRIEDTQFAL
jgi:hypothetical protein